MRFKASVLLFNGTKIAGLGKKEDLFCVEEYERV